MRACFGILIVIAGVGSLLFSFGRGDGRASAIESPGSLDSARLERGASLANRCAICHLEPDPAILPRKSWRIVLGDMGLLLGIEDEEYFREMPGFARVSLQRRDVLEHFGLLLGEGLLSHEQWSDLKYYYLNSAPSEPLPATGKPEMRWELEGFEVVEPAARQPKALTTLVRIREETSELYVGDSARNTLSLFDSSGARLGYPRKFRPEITPVGLAFDGDRAYIASIGDLIGADMIGRPGHVIQLDLSEDPYLDGDDFVLAEGLPRLAGIELADLDGNGEMDLIASGFGTAVGEVAVLANPSSGPALARVILNLPGTVKTQAHDFNGNGLLDVAVLLGHAREGVRILENRGGFEFREHVVFETHPGMGHTYFELQDFDGDGLVDLLVVNGDNVDSDPYNTYKNFHGIRIYLNRGGFEFEEAYFYPMRGAFVARAADFDLDGDLDIAAVAFYPDFEADRPESFVYLENKGDLEFQPRSLPGLSAGRWMTMDAGDLDGDGDIDIVLGGADAPIGMSQYPEAYERYSETGAAFLILRNKALSHE